MKDYMFVFMGPDYESLGLSPEEMDHRMQNWFAWTEKLGKEGRYVGGEALQTKGKRITGKEKIIVDSPSAESKELIGGFFVVKAENIDEALQLAGDFPDFDIQGTIEVREVVVFH